MEKVLCLIGGGATSIAFLDNFLNKLSVEDYNHYTIYVLEKNSTFGPGAAYNDDLGSNILNTKTGYITIFPDKKSDFFNWLHNHPEKWQWKYPSFVPHEDGYAPRPLFGQYLQHSFSTMVSKGIKKKVKIIPVNAEAIDVRKLRDNYTVITACSINIHADYVFLLCGTLENAKQDTPKMPQGIISNPYPVSKLSNWLKKESSIAIVGSRLSAIDAIIALKESGHSGKITMFSRSGHFPSVRGTQGRYALKNLTVEKIGELNATPKKISIEDIASLVLADLKQYFIENPDHPQEPVHVPEPIVSLESFLSNELELAKHPRGWQAVLYATNAIIDDLWSLLNTFDKERFREHYLSTFLAYRVSIPSENAKKIKSYLESGSLDFVVGNTLLAKDEDGCPVITNKADGAVEIFDFAIMATGSPKNYFKSNSNMLAALEERGVIAPHPYGGLDVDAHTYNIIGSDGNADNGIFAVGEITAGKFFFTSALDIIFRHARKCAINFHDSQQAMPLQKGSLKAN